MSKCAVTTIGLSTAVSGDRLRDSACIFSLELRWNLRASSAVVIRLLLLEELSISRQEFPIT